MSKLLDERKRQRKTLKDVADYIDVSTTAYYMYEVGDRKIPSNKVDEICNYLGISKDEYFESTNLTVR